MEQRYGLSTCVRENSYLTAEFASVALAHWVVRDSEVCFHLLLLQ